MKRRVTKVLNFFAFNLLFFALYLNFINKDKNIQEAMHNSDVKTNNTVIVENGNNPVQKEHSKESVVTAQKETAKLSVN